MTRTGWGPSAAGASSPKRLRRKRSRSSTCPAQRVGCFVSIASCTGKAGIGNQLQQPLQGEHGGALGVGVPVGRLLAVLPGSEVEGGEVGQFQGGDGATAVGGAVDPAVVDEHEVAVGGEPDIAFEAVGAVFDGFPVGGQGVLGSILRGAAVGDDLDGARHCVGHRVMVPPRGPTRRGESYRWV